MPGISNGGQAFFSDPYIVGMPLRPDTQLFVGREDIGSWIEDTLTGDQARVMVLYGQRRIGKTSILLQLCRGSLGRPLRERHRQPLFPVFIDMQGVASFGTEELLLWRIARGVVEALREHKVVSPVPEKAAFAEFPYRSFQLFLQKVGETLTRQTGDGLLVVMLDEYEYLERRSEKDEYDAEVIACLRSAMQQGLTRLLLCGYHRLDELGTVFQGIAPGQVPHKEVSFFGRKETELLVQQPVKSLGVTYDDEVLVHIWKLTGGHPYLIQSLCSSCIEVLNARQGGYQVTQEYLDEALVGSLQSGTIFVLEYLWRCAGVGGQAILQTLTTLVSDTCPWVGGTELHRRAADAGLSEASVHAALETLEKNRLVRHEQPAGQERRYCFEFDLLRLWLARKAARE